MTAKMMNTSDLLKTDEMYRADQMTIAAGTPGLNLMENAGTAIVREIEQRWPQRPVVVLCGPGNNGGDGFVVARLLRNNGWPVKVALLGALGALKGDAARNAMRWKEDLYLMTPDILEDAPLVVDALFGAGITRDVEGSALVCITAINDRGLECIGVDVPSAVDGNTGEIMGAAPKCVLTVTFFRAKPGHFLVPGRDLCGELIVADIGISKQVLEIIKPDVFSNSPDNWRSVYPWPRSNSHKYTRGHVIVRGGRWMTGAAQLAALATRRIGAGLVTISAPSAAADIYRSAMPGNLISDADTVADFSALLSDSRINVILIGPGMGVSSETRDLVLAALNTVKLVVLDADALTCFEDEPDKLLSQLNENHILTPHEGEFLRLFGIEGNKVSRAKEAAKRTGSTIVLKGADTVIAAPNGSTTINTTGTPFMATAGSGDVLAGIIAGLMAQGMTPSSAGCAAAWVHGRAGELFGPGLIAEDVIDMLPTVLNGLYSDRDRS